ncbi:MAG: AMP-binding protein [Candidatus Heimdallarchaeota archaeon]|nr:AMP-binding protein [Candidatus Heimdallarchaeota archaeon]
METCNITEMFSENADKYPDRTAIVVPVGRDRQGKSITKELSFKELNKLTNRYSNGFIKYGFQKGDRILLMVNPGIDLIAIVLALFKIGSVPVIIDPGMGLKAFSQCVSETEPIGFIGIPKSHILRLLFRKSFKTVKLVITLGKSRIWKKNTIDNICTENVEDFSIIKTKTDDEAVIAFTSGGTGIPKGVLFTHGMVMATVNSLRQDLKIKEGDIHLAAFYAFALFMPSLGATIIIPDMDPKKTSEINPAYLVEAIHHFNVSNTMGSPIIWKKLSEYCLRKNIRLSSLKYVFMFGAAVPPEVIENMTSIMEGGEVFTPYGATEALPITNQSGQEIINEQKSIIEEGKGVCVGKPIAGATVRIIGITDDPIPSWNDELELKQGLIGEIVAKGPTVTHTYINRPLKTAEAKIYSSDGIWHRMGDLGYFDEKGRLWFCGRMAHRVMPKDNLLTPVQCETIYNRHPHVKRSALVGLGKYGNQRPIIIIEPEPDFKPLSQTDKKTLAKDLFVLGKKSIHTQSIKDILIYDEEFPVDVRHNTKIQRHKLVVWARKNI